MAAFWKAIKTLSNSQESSLIIDIGLSVSEVFFIFFTLNKIEDLYY